MNKKFGFTNTKTKIAGIAALVVFGAAGVVASTPYVAHGEYDLATIQEEQTAQDATLANHEARLHNLEADVNKLQSATNTSPSEDKTSVPDGPVPSPSTQTVNHTPAPTPAPNTPPAQVGTSPASAEVKWYTHTICGNQNYYTWYYSANVTAPGNQSSPPSTGYEVPDTSACIGN